jgi:hypothetical protein
VGSVLAGPDGPPETAVIDRISGRFESGERSTPDMTLQRTRRPRYRSGRWLCLALGKPQRGGSYDIFLVVKE